MSAYLYPTPPCDDWVENIRDEWKESCKPYFSLWFLRVTPQQLISRECKGYPFWLYMYYSETKTKEYCPESLSQAMQVKFRIRVIDYEISDTNPYAENSVHPIEPPEAPTIWFKCDRFEEIRKNNCAEQQNGCSILTYHDFIHAENTDLASALQATIPPVRCTASIAVVQTNWYETQS